MKVSKKDNIKNISLFSILYYITYVLFMNIVYTSDHIAMHGFKEQEVFPSLISYISGGRFLSYFVEIFYYLLSFVGVTRFENKWVLQILLIFFLAVATNEIVKMYTPFFKDNYVILYALAYINFANPYFVESFVYCSPELGLGILLVIIASKKFIQKKFLGSIVFLFCGISLYQSYIALFFIYVSTYIFLENYKEIKREIMYMYVKLLLVGGIAALTNILIVKLCVNIGIVETEIKSVTLEGDLIEKMKEIVDWFKMVTIELLNISPGKMLFYSILLVSLICFVELLCLQKYLEIFYLAGTIICLNLFPYAISFVMEIIYFPPRVSWPIFPAFAMTMLLCICYMDKKWNKYLYKGVLFLQILFIYYGIETCILDMYISNSLDINNMYMIKDEIEEYEENTNIQITDIYVGHANNIDYYHNEAKHFDYYWLMYSHKIHYDTWSDVEFLNYITSSNYVEHEMGEEDKKELFENVRNNVFNASEQLVFEGDTLYWLVY